MTSFRLGLNPFAKGFLYRLGSEANAAFALSARQWEGKKNKVPDSVHSVIFSHPIVSLSLLVSCFAQKAAFASLGS